MTDIAQICLYGTPASGYAFLASRPGLAREIAAKGGWDRHETKPSGELRSLTETVAAAKVDLRALGLERGEVLVFMPGGELCARMPIDTHQSVGSMHLEPAPAALISAQTIERAAREIARGKAAAKYAEEWRENYVSWYRPALRRGAERLPVTIIRGHLVWVSAEGGAEGHWGIAQGFLRERRQIQVSGDSVDLERVHMRQEAIAEGIPAPAGASEPEHSPFALLIDALRSIASRGKTLRFKAADGTRHRLRIRGVSNDLGPGSIGRITVGGTAGGNDLWIVLPTDYDRSGAPVHPGEVRRNRAHTPVPVDPHTIRFEAPRSSSAKRSKAARARAARAESGGAR